MGDRGRFVHGRKHSLRCAWLWQPPFWGGLNRRSKNMCKLIQKRSLKVQSLLAPQFIRLCPASWPQCSVVTSSAGLSWVSVAEPGPCSAPSGHNVHSVTVVLNRAYCSYTHQEIYKYKIQILFYYWIFEVLFYPKSPSCSMCLSESIVAMHSSIWPLSSMGQAPSLLSLASTHSYNQGIQFQNVTVNNSSKIN